MEGQIHCQDDHHTKAVFRHGECFDLVDRAILSSSEKKGREVQHWVLHGSMTVVWAEQKFKMEQGSSSCQKYQGAGQIYRLIKHLIDRFGILFHLQARIEELEEELEAEKQARTKVG